MSSFNAHFPLDHFDVQILAMLQLDSHLSQRVIAEQVSLSAPAVQRRIKRLEEAGVIQAYVAVLEPGKVGAPMLLMIEVQIHNEKQALLAPLESRIAREAAVQQCYFITGQADYLLVVAVATMEEYMALTQRLFEADENVKRFTSSVVLRRVKVGLSLPLPAFGG